MITNIGCESRSKNQGSTKKGGIFPPVYLKKKVFMASRQYRFMVQFESAVGKQPGTFLESSTVS
jgi:hypothetical protein